MRRGEKISNLELKLSVTAGWAEVSDWALNMNYNSNFYSDQSRADQRRAERLN